MEIKEETKENKHFSKESQVAFKDIPILEKTNYGAWKDKIENFLKNKGLWDFVHEHKEGHESEYQTKRATIKFIFRKKCGACILPYIEGIDDIPLIWKQLFIMFEFNYPKKKGRMTMDGTNYTWCPPLHQAIVDGDWKTVYQFKSENDGGALAAMLTSEGELPLHVAVQTGNVEIVKELIKILDTDHLSQPDKDGRTALHIAASGGNLEIVKAMVEMDQKLVTIRSECYDGCFPVILAVRAGKKDVVKYLYPITKRQERNLKDEEYIPRGYDKLEGPKRAEEIRDRTRATFLTSLILGDFYVEALDLLRTYQKLVLIKDVDEVTAMDALSFRPSAFESSFTAIRSGIGTLGYHFQKFMYSYVDVDDKNAHCHTRGDVENSIDTNGERTQGNIKCGKGLSFCFHVLFQNALKLVPGYKHIYEEKLKHHSASMLLEEAWKQVSKQTDLGKVEDALVVTMFRATENGIVEFIKEIIKNCPQLLCRWYPPPHDPANSNYEGQTILGYNSDYEGQTIFHCAISNRQEKIFPLIHRIGPIKNDLARFADGSKNLMSHLAAKQAPIQRLNQVPGVAFQLQRELLWFQEVETFIPPILKEFRNKDNKTPRMLFKEEHSELLKDGAAWMKETATQCMVVATLITTIMFAAVFTIPVSKESGPTGEPNYIWGKFPIVYLVANILALCSSVASMLIFLAIITSRYSEEDFLRTLPKMLIMGLFFLFISIAGMMIEFVSAVLVMLRYDLRWVSFPIVFVASVPIIIYAFVEFPLFIQLIFATTLSDVLGKKSK